MIYYSDERWALLHGDCLQSLKGFPDRSIHCCVTSPPDLIEPCILAGSRVGDMVLDPFNGAGTTGLVALKHGRKYLGLELNPEYCDITVRRLNK